MKVFWGLVILLAVCAAGAAFWSGEDRRPSAPAGVDATGEAPVATPPTPEPRPTTSEKPAPPEPDSPPRTPPAVVPPAAPSVSIDAALDAATGAKPAPTPQVDPKASEPANPAEVKADEKNAPEAKPATADASAEPESGPPPKIEEQPDGVKLIDGRYALKGDGSKEKPYEVTWEMLVSAQETYEPSAGKKKIPGRIMMLDGRYIKLTGYVAFPLAVSQPKELLSMLNQWDGCCIGVPPTPYDAVEVQLLDRVIGENRQATYGVVQGRLTVKPYVVGDWLVGLYLMTDAEFRPTQFGGT
jgi:hypothetical protein